MNVEQSLWRPAGSNLIKLIDYRSVQHTKRHLKTVCYLTDHHWMWKQSQVNEDESSLSIQQVTAADPELGFTCFYPVSVVSDSQEETS